MKALPVLALVVLCACSPRESVPETASSVAQSETSSMSIVVAVMMIPDRFLGRWDADAQACKAESDMKLSVAGNELRFYESVAKVKAVSIKSPSDITVDADMSGEGETWTKSLHMVLSPDGQTLTIDEGKTGVRVRCQ